MKRIIRNSNLNASSVQGIIERFYKGLASWDAVRHNNPRANPPNKSRRFFIVPFKEHNFSIKNSMLRLSTGRDNIPLVVPWQFDKPKYCELSYNGKQYVLNATYVLGASARKEDDGFAGIDLGDIHLAAVYTGKQTILINGKEVRSKRRYKNKTLGKFQSQMDRCKKGSRKWRRLNGAKDRINRKLNNQIDDILHKQTTALISFLNDDEVKTVGIGDLRNIRDGCNNPSRASNQQLHQMPSGKVTHMLTYKAKRLGMAVRLINETYTSQICPQCLERNKTKDRNYKCRFCAFEGHRDVVGAFNIWSKTKYRKFTKTSVVGGMTAPVGIRYKSNIPRISTANQLCENPDNSSGTVEL
jgi:putative transposase